MPHKRLLLVEDDYDVAEMLMMYFQSHNYEVMHADTGMGGIELARTRFPNLILLDVMLPYMDGYDVCIRLRGNSMTKHIPILFLTQRDERASKVRGLELGADDYITKPFDIDELRLRIRGSINRATRENLHETRTGLPTGPLIQDEIDYKLRNSNPFFAITYRIAAYRTFSDVYGFMVANDVLNHAANIIKTVTTQMGTENDFVGIDGDDLVVLTYADNIDELDQTIRQKFNEEVRTFYSFIDAERGGILVNEGTTEELLIPLMRLDSFVEQHPVAGV